MTWDWPALEAELQRTLLVKRRDPRGFVGVTAEGAEVVVEHARGASVEWLVLRAVICAQKDMDPELVLERNANLALAAIALANGSYWLRVAVPFDSEDLRDPARLVAHLVEGARSLSPQHLAPDPSAGDVFKHFTT